MFNGGKTMFWPVKNVKGITNTYFSIKAYIISA